MDMVDSNEEDGGGQSPATIERRCLVSWMMQSNMVETWKRLGLGVQRVSKIFMKASFQNEEAFIQSTVA